MVLYKKNVCAHQKVEKKQRMRWLVSVHLRMSFLRNVKCWEKRQDQFFQVKNSLEGGSLWRSGGKGRKGEVVGWRVLIQNLKMPTSLPLIWEAPAFRLWSIFLTGIFLTAWVIDGGKNEAHTQENKKGEGGPGVLFLKLTLISVGGINVW